MREKLSRLLRSDSSNREIALGLAVGMFVSFFPIYGPQMLACLAIVLIFRRLNRIAVFLGVQFSWLYPLVVYCDYQVGRLIMPGEHPAFRMADFQGKGFAHVVSLVRQLFPLLLAGSLVAGALAAVLTYAIAAALLMRYRKQPQLN
jgi:uncharacterized protein (TIGR03546 family)